MSLLIGITGGIGSGKSVVCTVLRTMGYRVYDCDTEARRIMEHDELMRQRIFSEVCAEARASDGSVDRKRLAEAVFADAELLKRLNKIVHGAVRTDLLNEASHHHIMFFESAILYSSGFWNLADVVWEVNAPEEIRVERASRRDNAEPESIRARIASQTAEVCPASVHPVLIVNDGFSAVLPQIERALDELK